MINEIALSIADVLAGVKSVYTALMGRLGTSGIPSELIDGLIEQGAAMWAYSLPPSTACTPLPSLCV